MTAGKVMTTVAEAKANASEVGQNLPPEESRKKMIKEDFLVQNQKEYMYIY
jgi:hypothetical protein